MFKIIFPIVVSLCLFYGYEPATTVSVVISWVLGVLVMLSILGSPETYYEEWRRRLKNEKENGFRIYYSLFVTCLVIYGYNFLAALYIINIALEYRLEAKYLKTR